MKILAVVPAYNEEKNIRNVVQSIQSSCPEIDVVVINDGSTDNTYLEAVKGGAWVINLLQNLGIGGAVQTGYIYAQRNNYDLVVQVDGDGQHNPRDLRRLVELIRKNEADMVIGSRFIKKTAYKPTGMRQAGILFFSKLVSVLCRQKYYDTTSGFRAVNRKGIELFSQYYPKDYPEVETIVFAFNRGIRITEIPVNMDKRQGGKSSITPLRSLYYMLKVTCVLMLQPKLHSKTNIRLKENI
ncbi:glycosyl transferase [Desulfitobacterium dehalogenans ATCC 51507]|uniref:Glycosyl transferase n=1 Tax=Desulfitobacterium dehalogenans (strain ATCC 51507 / DSM 9161 / JW/IU-DC1) TaxID=756499 RepID=I4A7N1_DESDJ|nr:glycosyltransferase family 2 protein [Desulfitobacterium dehalogenans]AFL99965.1 glycosyl transferase [Desulfitobacterium dehalogenans ATCC 51507]